MSSSSGIKRPREVPDSEGGLPYDADVAPRASTAVDERKEKPKDWRQAFLEEDRAEERRQRERRRERESSRGYERERDRERSSTTRHRERSKERDLPRSDRARSGMRVDEPEEGE